MTDEPSDGSTSAGPDPAAPTTPATPAGPDPGAPPPRRRNRRSRSSRRSRPKPTGRRRVIRWVANLIIVAGVLLIPSYYGATCACTAIEQNRLRDELEAVSPQLLAAPDALMSGDFIWLEEAEPTLDPSATPEQVSALQAAIAAAKAERDAQLAAFKAAADAFEASLTGVIGEAIGRIIIPSIGLDVVMVEGTSKGDLKEGPGHWEETPYPGQGGNFVVSGHRSTYGAPFFKFDKVKVGDRIDLVLPYAVVRYVVSKNIIIQPREMDTVAQRDREQVSLAACHPIYSARQRIVVQGELIGFKLLEPEAGAPISGG